MAKAYGAMINVLGGPDAFLQYKMIETGMYEKLAKANSQAVHGMQPKITTWNTGKSYLIAQFDCQIINIIMIIQARPPATRIPPLQSATLCNRYPRCSVQFTTRPALRRQAG